MSKNKKKLYTSPVSIYSLATPKDTWPSMEKPGLSMQLDENKDGYDVIVHTLYDTAATNYIL